MRLIESVFWAKVFIRFVIIGFLALLGITFIISSFSKPVPLNSIFVADNGCGSLPSLNLHKIDINYQSADIRLNVQQQLYQDIPSVVYVYRVNLVGETFTTKQKAFDIAKIFGFEPTVYTKPQATLYQWSDNRRFLQFDTSNSNFYYSLKTVAFPPIPNPDIPPVAEAQTIARNVYNMFDNAGNSKVYTFMVDLLPDGKDVEVDSLEAARAVRVDFQKELVALKYPSILLDDDYRKKHPNVKINFIEYYQLGDNDNVASFRTNTVAEAPFLGGSQVYVISRIHGGIEDIGRVKYSNWKLEDIPCGTYSIISPEEAFSSIQKGDAVLVYAYKWGGDRLKPVTNGNIVSINVFNIYLAYYQPAEQQPFLQPIYVIEGDARLDTGERLSVFFYVPAIKNL